MNLYEINDALALWTPEVDEETGELLNAAALDELNAARERKIEVIALWIKDLAAEIADFKEEETALAARRRAKERKADSLRRYLAANLDGQAFETTRCKVTFRNTERVETGEGFLAWAMKNRDDLLTYTNPKPDKLAIKAALKAGEEIPGAELVADKSMTVK